MARSGAQSTHPAAQDAARESLASGASALSAAISGFFAAAGSDAGVLFSPLCLVVGGLGTGVFVYDGRVRQPGRGAKRPRGFLDESEVPEGALAAVPTGLAALAVSCAFHPGTSLLSCSKVGVSAARASGKKSRAELIDRVAGLGARALLEPGLKKELLARFGAVEGGSLTGEDLIAPSELQSPAIRERDQTGSTRWLPSWQTGETPAEETSAHLGQGHGLVAIDPKGLSVALIFRNLSTTLYLERQEVSFPALGSPVMRGVTRKSPGQVLASSGTLWLSAEHGGLPVGATAKPVAAGAPLVLRRDPDSKEVFSQLGSV